MTITATIPAAPNTFGAYRSAPGAPITVALVVATATRADGSTLVLSHGALAALGTDEAGLAARQPLWTGVATDPADALARATA